MVLTCKTERKKELTTIQPELYILIQNTDLIGWWSTMINTVKDERSHHIIILKKKKRNHWELMVLKWADQLASLKEFFLAEASTVLSATMKYAAPATAFISISNQHYQLLQITDRKIN